ncbi:MAG: hypothetical protein LAP13_20590 [Acidobacteriia bacterium]|nr:hypothetical protein [Terriglobia bacterium]
MRNIISVCFGVISLCFIAAAQGGPQRGPSTVAEREHAVAIAHKLEEAPLDKSLRPDREWALLWLIQVPDVHVTLCLAVLGDFMKSKYKYSPEVTAQLTLSTAAFVIEHPEKVSDVIEQYAAGVEGVLKAYKAILRDKPQAKSKALEDLLEKQSRGELAEFIRESSKGCTQRTGE